MLAIIRRLYIMLANYLTNIEVNHEIWRKVKIIKKRK